MSLKLHSAFQAPSKRELAQTESPVDFPCKLSSERVTRASVLAVFLEHLPEIVPTVSLHGCIGTVVFWRDSVIFCTAM